MAAKRSPSPDDTPSKKSAAKKKALPPADTSSGFLIEHPVSFWNRPLKADFPKLFAGFGGAIGGYVSGRWDSGIKSALEAITAVTIPKVPAQIAWRLIFISLARASDALITEAVEFDLFNTDDQHCAAKAERIAAGFEEITIALEPDFFQHPGKLSLLKPFGETFRQWLAAWGIEEARADAIRGRLASYFVFELRREWRKNPSAYEPLAAALATPFDAACEKERSWLEYAASLQHEISKPMFDESFSLDDIYIPLRGAYYKQLRPKRRARKAPEEEKDPESEHTMVDLHDHLLHWAKSCTSEDALRVLSGGPGSGKSSFCKIFAARNADALRAEGITTVFISLHHFEPGDDLVAAIKRHLVEGTRQLAYNPLDKDELASRSVLLICDGLDELSQQGYVGARVASEFVRGLTTTLSRLNNDRDTRIRAIITGREIVISSNKAEFHGERLLEVIPFCPPHEDNPHWPKHGDKELLSADQRDLWWRTYGTLTGRGYVEIPKELATPQLREITAQPLLNYLVSLAWERRSDDTGIRFDDDTSLNDIYEDLIRAVHERAYEPSRGKNRQHSAIQDLKLSDFFLLLEEIALSAWHGDGRKTTITEIHKHLESGGLLDLVEKLGAVESGARSGITKLLVAFFFRESEVKGAATDDTFEFTHKSFGEYLSARRLVRLMAGIVEERQRKTDNPTKGWDIPEALDQWASVTGPTRIDPYLFKFFTREIARQLHDRATDALQWRDIFARLFHHVVLHGTPMRNVPTADFLTLRQWAGHAEESLLAAYHGCLAIAGAEANGPAWPEDRLDAIGTWLHRIRGQRSDDMTDSIPVGLLALQRLYLVQVFWGNQDLDGADLDGANLNGATLEGATLIGASLAGASLIGATLYRAALDTAFLEGADLDEALLYAASLYGSTLDGARLVGADLDRAEISEASLLFATLDGANLHRANLHRANLDGASMTSVNLVGANLREASLEDANLEGAILEQAELDGANLNNAVMHSARIRRSQLSEEQITAIIGDPDWLPEE